MITVVPNGRERTPCLTLGVIFWLLGVATLGSAQDPNNAALLYYQACLTYPDSGSKLDDIVRGHDPNDEVRRYLHQPQCREAIELVEIATRIPRCDWGVVHSRGVFLPTTSFSSFQRLFVVLVAHAETLAADGQYRPALESCIGMRHFAAHLGDDGTLMWDLSHILYSRATSTIRYVLGVMPPDEATLTWLKEQLHSVPGALWRPQRALQSHADMEVQRWLTHPRARAEYRRPFLDGIEDDTVRRELEKLSESELFARARESSEKLVREATAILTADAPYKEKQANVERFVHQMEDRGKRGDPACLVGAPWFADPYYRVHINDMAHFNAVLNAIEIYLARARTGQLPTDLPGGLPPDPYSGESFQYEATATGFTLRCRAQAAGYQEIRKFDFKVR
jgi:hypothetical protein